MDGDRSGSQAKGNKEPLYSSTEAGSPIPPNSVIPAGKGAGNPTGSFRDEQVLVLPSLKRFLLPFDKIIINNNMKK